MAKEGLPRFYTAKRMQAADFAALAVGGGIGQSFSPQIRRR